MLFLFYRGLTKFSSWDLLYIYLARLIRCTISILERKICIMTTTLALHGETGDNISGSILFIQNQKQ